MSVVRKVIIRTLVKSFYQDNAGFFLVSLGLVFGFLKTPQHIDIATALAFSPLYYFIPLIIWGLYTLKTLQYCQNARRLEANRFLSYLVLLTGRQRKGLVLYIQALLLIPILGYSVLLLFVALQHQLWVSAILVVAGNIAILVMAATALERMILRPVDPHANSSLRRWTQRLPRKRYTLFIHHLFQRQVVLLLGTKLISLLTITGFIAIYNVEGTDTRFLSLGMLLSAGVNSSLAYHHHLFSLKDLSLFRNLPISTHSWFLNALGAFSILCLPELLVLFGQNLWQVPFFTLLENALLPITLLSFYYAVCHLKPVNAESFVKYPFFGTAILFFVILGHAPIHWLVLLLLVTAQVVFKRYFLRFDPGMIK